MRTRNEVTQRRAFPLAISLIFVVTTAFMLAQTLDTSVLETLRRTPAALPQGEFWRLVTPMVVHSGGWPHYGVNMIGLVALGVPVERRVGRARTVAIYLVAGVLGELVGFAWRPHGAGASVGVFGLLGALFVLTSTRRSGPVRTCIWTVVVVSSAISVLARDVHGVPMLAGGVIAAFFHRRTAESDQEKLDVHTA